LARDAHEPHAIASRLWWKTAFPSHPYGRSTRGTPETLAGITPDDMRGLVHARFAKDVMVLGIVGDITPAALKPLLDQTFGGLPAHAAPGEVPEVVAHGSAETLLVQQPIPQSVVTFGEAGLKRNDPDWYAALVVQYILGGGGLTSRLASEVREKRGLAYSVSIGLDPMAHTGVILGGVGTENAHVAESIALIRSEWQRMRAQGPTAKELADAKTYLTGSFPLSLDSTGRIAATLVAMERDGLGADYLDHRSALIDAVTLADAKRVAKRLFDPAALFFVVVGAPENLVGAHSVTATGG
jgi:zinc protease